MNFMNLRTVDQRVVTRTRTGGDQSAETAGRQDSKSRPRANARHRVRKMGGTGKYCLYCDFIYLSIILFVFGADRSRTEQSRWWNQQKVDKK